MASPRERAPGERETLIFSSPEEAQDFRERVGDHEKRVAQEGVEQRREVLAEEVAVEFARHGDDIGQYEQPWEHDEKEHKQVQELVNVAFTDDLETALKLARKSAQYPRIIDLLHDVLTGRMYDEMVADGVNTQSPRSRAVLIGGGLVALLVVAALVLFVL